MELVFFFFLKKKNKLAVNVQVDAAWKALKMKTRSPEKFTDVREVEVLTTMVFCPIA